MSADTKSWKSQTINHPPGICGKRHLDFHLVKLILDSGLQNCENKFLSFQATKFEVIYYSSHRKQIQGPKLMIISIK